MDPCTYMYIKFILTEKIFYVDNFIYTWVYVYSCIIAFTYAIYSCLST